MLHAGAGPGSFAMVNGMVWEYPLGGQGRTLWEAQEQWFSCFLLRIRVKINALDAGDQREYPLGTLWDPWLDQVGTKGGNSSQKRAPKRSSEAHPKKGAF